MTEYPPEKVAGLIAELRNEKWEAEALARQVHWRLYKKAADALAAVSAERDEARAELRQERAKVRGLGFALDGIATERDRLRRAITEALAERMSMEADRILRAALDKEWGDDE